MYRK
ncbi:hypothetical protein EYF80_055658 [Liparis tanakae]|jgi:tubulin-folding cofactor B